MSASQAQQANDDTNIDPRYKRSCPAGPFSQVNTELGVLQTSVPLFELEGKGNTSIGFSIYHRSNQANGTQYGYVNGGAGRGWTISPVSSVQSSVWSMGGNQSQSWTYSYINGKHVYNRDPGTRADMTAYTVSGLIRGWDIVTQDDKTKYVFRQDVITGQVYRITQVIDSNGNTVNYGYDSADRPILITDASGQRSITIGYTPT